MDTRQPSTLIDLRLLRLEQAKLLLEQSGHAESTQTQSGTQMLQAVVDGLCDLSQRDALTGLANRRHFNSVLEREVDRVARSGDPALLLMLDIDHFKKINDTHGHAAGDQVLRDLSARLLDCVRPMDTVARYGGEEFAVVLPSCQRSFGSLVAERIRSAVEQNPTTLADGTKICVTVSIGGAFAPEWIRSSSALWIERADLQLYSAKVHGRNRVHLEYLPESAVSAEERSLLLGPSVGDFSDGSATSGRTRDVNKAGS